MTTLKQSRMALKLTQKQIAEVLGVTETTWASWERGEVMPNSPKMLNLALEALQARAFLNSSEYIERQNKIMESMNKTLSVARQRVKHKAFA